MVIFGGVALYGWSDSIGFKRGSDDNEESVCKIEGDFASDDPMDKASGGVKVLSEKTGSYENFLNWRDGSGIDSNEPGDLTFARTANPFSSHYPFLI